MKNFLILLILTGCAISYSCKKDEVSERFSLLTGPIWVSDSLLANGVDASGPGGILEKFKGDAKFNKDGTGYFGNYTGTWDFAYNETEITIYSDSLLFALTTQIVELTKVSLKVTTAFPTANPQAPIHIRMTFKAK